MGPEQFYKAVLDLTRERQRGPLLDAALTIAKQVTRAAAVQLELVGGRHTDDPAWTCTHAAPAVCVPVMHGTVCLRAGSSPLRLDRPWLDTLVRQLAVVLDSIARNDPRVIPLPVEIRELRSRRIAQALERNRGNVAAAARELDVARSHIYDVAYVRRRKRSDVEP
jgi:hypothetical protein